MNGTFALYRESCARAILMTPNIFVVEIVSRVVIALSETL